MDRVLLSGNEAVALGALHAGVQYGSGYPGTPSTEILESFSKLGGNAGWAPNEKVALEVGIGVAFAGSRSLVTMKHVGVNVAADPLFTVAYTGIDGGLVLISADDPGMASSQNEQDNRHYARAAGIPMLEPCDSQEAYEFTRRAFAISGEWKTPVMVRMTTRVCHSKTIVVPREPDALTEIPKFQRNMASKVMIPAFARPARHRLRLKLESLSAYGETCDLNRAEMRSSRIGIVATGIAIQHSLEACPDASLLKLGMSFPVPFALVEQFAKTVETCWVIEEGDPWLFEALSAHGIRVCGKPPGYTEGELNVARVRNILSGVVDEQVAAPQPGKPPELCPGCPHRTVFEILSRLGCIVSGDIGCYSLGALPPFLAMDTCVCMGASIGVGLGLRHVLPETDARKVVSVIGDSTFFHSGLTGLVEAVYNCPPTGHVILVLDNRTTAMTGLQEHPGTGRTISGKTAPSVEIESLAKAAGASFVHVSDPQNDPGKFESLIKERLAAEGVSVLVARRPCILSAVKHSVNRKEIAQ
jgi:indolepyruvate ferredoxin oxidoreductase alpha subunit